MKFRTSMLACAVAGYVAPAVAHHSFSMFDHEKTIKISGTVKEFEFTNPHAWIHVITQDAGKPVDWSFEMGSVGQITAQGWKRDSIRPGDKITVEAHPLKDGSHGGQYSSATLADGQTMRPAADGNNNGRVP